MTSKRPVEGSPSRPSAVQLRAKRSPRLIALGVLAVVLGALGSVALHNATTETMSVVGVANSVSRGELLRPEDLTVVDVPQGFAVETSPSSQLDSLVGQTTLTDLPAGAFPLSTHVGDDPLPDGQALVGLKMQYGQIPVSAMPKGTVVQLVGLSTEEGAPKLDTRAVVAVAPSLLDDGSTFTLDLRVAESDASTVAQLAAAGLVAVVVVNE